MVLVVVVVVEMRDSVPVRWWRKGGVVVRGEDTRLG
jgi:hypothetical protein